MATGEDGRFLYGTSGADGAGPSRVDDRFGQVIEVRNASGNHAVSVTGQLQKRFGNGTELGASYTYSRSEDRLSADADNTDAELDGAPLDGSLEQRRLTEASWNVPHRVTFLGTANLPFGFRGAVFYEGLAGAPVHLHDSGDANADGFGGNDIMYVPRDPSPVATSSSSCRMTPPAGFVPAPAAEYTGLARRSQNRTAFEPSRAGSCGATAAAAPGPTTPTPASPTSSPPSRATRWSSVWTSSTCCTWSTRTGGGYADPTPACSQLVGWDGALGRGVYHRIRAVRNFVAQDASRWRMQLGGRYTF